MRGAGGPLIGLIVGAALCTPAAAQSPLTGWLSGNRAAATAVGAPMNLLPPVAATPAHPAPTPRAAVSLPRPKPVIAATTPMPAVSPAVVPTAAVPVQPPVDVPLPAAAAVAAPVSAEITASIPEADLGPADAPIAGAADQSPPPAVAALPAVPASAMSMPSPAPVPPPPYETVDLAKLRQPFEAVRALQRLQDEIARGSLDAFRQETAVRGRVEEVIKGAPPGDWSDERNMFAVITYVLSGGAPSGLAAASQHFPEGAVARQMVDGVLAYGNGDQVVAREKLAAFPLDTLPASLAGPLAVARATLEVVEKPAEARALLQLARLLAPGTLVEEAALRREIVIAERLGDAEGVEQLARRYFTRFRQSVYAGNFRNRFAAIVSGMSVLRDPAQLPRLEAIMQYLDPAPRRDLYLALARAALLSGEVKVGAIAAERALALSGGEPAKLARARLYQAAGLLADAARIDEARQVLGAIDRTLLDGADGALLPVVEETIGLIESGTRVDKAAADSAAPEGESASTALIERGRAALKATDMLIAGVP